jgi:hypothetical protein
MNLGLANPENGADEFAANLRRNVKNMAQVPVAASICDNLRGYNRAAL